MQQMLKNGPYREQALVPKSPWMKTIPLTKPTLKNTNIGNDVVVNWELNQPKAVFLWVLYSQYGDTWKTEILDRNITEKKLLKTENGKPLHNVAIKAIDRLGNESEYYAVRIK